MTRLIQRAYLRAVQVHLEATLLDSCHSYRPGRSHLTALLHAQQLARGGHHFFAEVDIRRFFKSIHIALLDDVLGRVEWMGRCMWALVRWFLSSVVLRRPNHPERVAGSAPAWNPAPGHLLEGSVIAPMLSNLVGTEIVDRPMLGLAPDVKVVRFSDNILVAATTATACARAVDKLERLLSAAGLTLHADRGHRDPVDVNVTPLGWLGKVLHGGSVSTSTATMLKMVDRVVGAQLGTAECRTACASVLDDLRIDTHRQNRLDRVHRELARRSRAHASYFSQLRLQADNGRAAPASEVASWEAVDEEVIGSVKSAAA
jgi:hypothetical protein